MKTRWWKPRQPTTTTTAVANTSVPGGAREPTDEQREMRLRSASHALVGRWLFDGIDRNAVLETVRDRVPGFGVERYEEALAAAVAPVLAHRERVIERRAQLITAAMEDDVLNAVFAIYYHNSRFAGHDLPYGLGPIDIHSALAPRYSRDEVDDALPRVSAAIGHGLSAPYPRGDDSTQRQAMREAHPGISDRHIGNALGWGHHNNR